MILENTDYNSLFNIGAMPNYFADSLGNVGPVTLGEIQAPKTSNKLPALLIAGVCVVVLYKWMK